MIKRVTIYARVSTQDQRPENQVRDLKRFAKDRGLNIIKLYQEKASAAANRTTGRPQFQKLLDDVRKRKTDAVLVWKLDRLARSTRELLNRLEEFRTLGVELLSYTENIDTTTPAGKALFGMVAIFAEFENDIRSERIIAGMQTARENGKHLGRPHLSPDTIRQVKYLKSQKQTDAAIMRETSLSRNTIKKYTR
jgi:DNA invertase Pin-like site-specific DNA recombinase